uniref:Uncharacterized protein n=1 Tax=Oryza sativa subsp. japonica TaxID=39947 RepID=Q8LNI6_ORYSJ|nr:hypothetical protein [Oryza sativa Japonica Group]
MGEEGGGLQSKPRRCEPNHCHHRRDPRAGAHTVRAVRCSAPPDPTARSGDRWRSRDCHRCGSSAPLSVSPAIGFGLEFSARAWRPVRASRSPGPNLVRRWCPVKPSRRGRCLADAVDEFSWPPA